MPGEVAITSDMLPAPKMDGTIVRVGDLPKEDPGGRWLVDGLWSDEGVGVVGAPPKTLKTRLMVDMMVSVCSGSPCLGQFTVPSPGPVLAFIAEGREAAFRNRVAAVCDHRGLPVESLDLFYIRRSRLLIDNGFDFHWLESQVAKVRPRLLVLDPLAHVFGGDEDDAGQVARALGLLLKLRREHKVAVVLVHHNRKAGAHLDGSSLRGSSAFHAWTDSAMYLGRVGDWRSGPHVARVAVEHRDAPSPDPFRIRLATEGGPGTEHLVYEPDEPEGSDRRPEQSVEEQIVSILSANESIGHGAIRDQLGVQGQRVADALQRLEGAGQVEKDGRRWRLRSVPSSS